MKTFQIAASMRSGTQVAMLAGVDVLTIPPKVAADYLAMNISESDVTRHYSADLPVNIDAGPIAGEVSRLWEIDEQFMAFTEDAVKHADQMVRGEDLVKLSRKHQVNLFGNWTEDDRREIREKGKIPDVSQWPGAPIDDMTSISAIESFAKDQTDLDARIASILREQS